jgi:hypothetical protein
MAEQLGQQINVILERCNNMIPTKLNPLGFNPHYDGVMEFTEVGNGIYRCYGETTQYQNDGRNLLPLPDGEASFDRGEGQHMTWIIKDNKIKMVGDTTNATTYEARLKLTNGYKAQFNGSSALNEYFLPAGTYTISIQNKSGSASVMSAPALRLTTTGGKIYQVTWNHSKGVTFTTEDPIAFAHIHGFRAVIDCEFNIQIEEGSTMTEWKPYTTNPTPTVDNPSPIISNYPKGRYKTNLPGITIKLDDDLRGLDEYKDYVEVDVVTKETSITRNVKLLNPLDASNVRYYNYMESYNSHQIIVDDKENKWSSAMSTHKAYSTRFKYIPWSYVSNAFYINRRVNDTLIQCFVTDEYLESFDNNGVKNFFTNYPTYFVCPLGNPITTLL